jgi:hypothetical protein
LKVFVVVVVVFVEEASEEVDMRFIDVGRDSFEERSLS